MRTAETILNIIQDRGTRRLPLDDVYRQMYNPNMYLRAYAKLYKNDGAMTPGITEETVDGMSQEKIAKIIEAIRYERWQWTPVRRVEIPKSNGKMRPLGMPTWSDKMVQEVIRSILEAYYEPQFSQHSHGFRPKRGCQTALIEIHNVWLGTKWFIEGDIKGCFDNIDHTHPDEHPSRKHPRQSLPAIDRRSPESGILRGMDIPPISERLPTRWDSKPNTIQHLHGQVRQVHTRNTHSRIHRQPKEEGTPRYTGN